jgi:hypothetical protein
MKGIGQKQKQDGKAAGKGPGTRQIKESREASSGKQLAV